jgi:multicomponent Na+:H+ antiporter subunit E
MTLMNRLLSYIRQGLHLAPLLLLFWWALTGGTAWLFGAAAIILAAVLGRYLAPALMVGVSLMGLLRFMLFFLYRSVLGGVDVAWRALAPRMPLTLQCIEFESALPPGQAQTLFVATISLLPGTLACGLDGNRVLVHSIAGDPEAELRELEARVSDLYSGKVIAEGA